MRRLASAVVTMLLLFSFVPTGGFAQNLNGTIGGFVQDPTRAYIPGATVTATNTQTGVVTRSISNESGSYNCPSIVRGVYRLTAELPSFKPYTYNDVQLGAGVALRFNFTLEIGEVTQAVEVSADVASLIAQSSATVGQVLNTTTIRDLPLASNNVLD